MKTQLDDLLFDVASDVAERMPSRVQPSPSQLIVVPPPPPPPINPIDLLDPAVHVVSNQLHGYRDLSRKGLLTGTLQTGAVQTVELVMRLLKTLSQLELAETEREARMTPEQIRARLMGLLDVEQKDNAPTRVGATADGDERGGDPGGTE